MLFLHNQLHSATQHQSSDSHSINEATITTALQQPGVPGAVVAAETPLSSCHVASRKVRLHGRHKGPPCLHPSPPQPAVSCTTLPDTRRHGALTQRPDGQTRKYTGVKLRQPPPGDSD